MKAAVYREHSKDPRQVVKIEDIDTPKPKANEVLIKVEAASYNYNDLWGIWGEPIKIPMPHISGSDAAGTVVEVGENVVYLMQSSINVIMSQKRGNVELFSWWKHCINY